MHVVLLAIGLVSVLAGAALGYAGYVNFDFSYGATLATIASVALVGGLLLIAAAAIIKQLVRVRLALEAGPSRMASSVPAGARGEAEAPDAEERRLPVLPPRPPSARAADREARQESRPTLDDAVAGHNPSRSAPPELPGLNRSDRLFAGDAPGDSAALAPPAEEMTGVSDDIQPTEAGQAVTILKSGVIEGMAYTLYSDGSVEAELPQGIMRFASVTEWREYLRSA